MAGGKEIRLGSNDPALVENTRPMERAYYLQAELPEDFLLDRQDQFPQIRTNISRDKG